MNLPLKGLTFLKFNNIGLLLFFYFMYTTVHGKTADTYNTCIENLKVI